MALQTLNTIKDWFKTGLKPSQTQFWDTWDSFRHKNDKVPVAEVDGINELLAQVSSTIIYKTGQLCVFKNPSNENESILEAGDMVTGIVEDMFINASYLGGDSTLLSSFDIVNQTEI
ncbi:hypothetical protein [Flavobacterium polysaccharolyticum]|uniref:S1 motif domain-containing protein n=1 Tax=Flavobacterium polysaccharolyticum TaxID=3133148 RepID=A0ABU9NJ56_9FLAO